MSITPEKASLTTDLQSSSTHSANTTQSPSPSLTSKSTPPHHPTPRQHRTSFDFFTLNNDGSVPDLIETHPPPGQTTPPAALSSLAVKMADRNMDSSFASLDSEQYDMVSRDDVSEVSNDDNETVSIASTDEDDGQMTPEETGSIIDADEASDMHTAPGGSNPTMSQAGATAYNGNHARRDQQMQIMLLEQQNERRRLQASRDKTAEKLNAKLARMAKDTPAHLGYKRQLQLLEQLNERRRLEGLGDTTLEGLDAELARQAKDNPALLDYQRQLLLLERLNRERLSRARQIQDDTSNVGPEKARLEADDMLMSEDLETPRQSTYQTLLTQHDQVKPSSKDANKGEVSGVVSALVQSIWNSYVLKAFAILLVAYFALSPILRPYLPSYHVEDFASRREALSDGLRKMTGNPQATESFNIEQLVPSPTPLSDSVYGTQEFASGEVRYQGVPPNTIVVSLPWSSLKKAHPVKAIDVSKSNTPIAFNTTQLLDGIYAVTFDPAEAYGIVTVNLVPKARGSNITLSHNFGRRFFNHQAYKKAGSDLSATVNKDVASACHTAKTLSQRLHLDIGAGMAATRNVTTQLAVQMTRDLQLWANNAVAVVSHARNNTSYAIRADLTQAREELRNAGKELQAFIGRTTDMIRSPLALSRERAITIKDRLQARKARKVAKQANALQVLEKQAKKQQVDGVKTVKAHPWFGKAEVSAATEQPACQMTKLAKGMSGKGGCGCAKKAGGCTCKNCSCKKAGAGGCGCTGANFGAKTRPTVKPSLL